MNKERIIKALEERDCKVMKDEMKLLFETKLERKIWKIYNSIESDLKLEKEAFKKK